ncbi:MAG: hypothetical protein JXB50_09170 [Spirochaetes bacterium]|nr:hypothetical protein [Spirochaetota bacterium]
MLFRRILCAFLVVISVALSHLSCNLPAVNDDDIEKISDELESNKYDKIDDSNFNK